jgi:hypothetical protein
MMVELAWLPPVPAAALMAAVIGFAILSILWINRIAADGRAKPPNLLSGFAPFIAVVAGPLLVVAGVATSLFFFGPAETVLLRSSAVPNHSKPTPKCFDFAFEALRRGTAGATPPPGCDTNPALLDSERILDARPLVKRAQELFLLNSPLTAEQLADRSDQAVIDRIRSVVLTVLATEPPAIDQLPQPPDPTPIKQRWIAEAIETSIIEGLTLSRKVRNVVVERHVANADATDQWGLLQNRLGQRLGTQKPVFRVTEGTPLSSDAHVSFFGNPWVQTTDAGSTIYAMLLKGPREAEGALVLRNQLGVVMTPRCAATGHVVRIETCADSFDAWLEGTTRLLVMKVAEALPPGPLSMEMTVAATQEVRKADIESYPTDRTFTVSGDPKLVATIACLSTFRDDSPLWAAGYVPAGAPRFVPAGTDPADVMLIRSNGQLWIYPADLDESLRRSLLDNTRTQQVPNSFQGKWLFPYAARADGLPPGAGQIAEAPLMPTRSGGPVSWAADPTLGIDNPKALWLDRSDARPVLYAYAIDNYIQFHRRISTSSPIPIGWRIDLEGGRTTGAGPETKASGRAVVWVFAFDLETQGLLLETCVPPLDTDIVPEPAYDFARFAPLWSTVLEAMRASADRGRSEGLLVQSPATEPVPAILEDGDRSRLQMRVARTGMMLIMAGLLIQATLMIWFRFKASKSVGRSISQS